MIRKHRTFIVTGVLYFTLGLIGLLLREDFLKFYDANPLTLSTASVALILAGIMSILFVYLQGGFTKEVPNEPYTDSSLAKHIEKLREELTQRIESKSSTVIDGDKLNELISEKVDTLTTEIIFDKIEEKYEDRLIDDIKFKSLLQEIELVKHRIDRETARTSRNANLNLLIGFFTTFMAIFFLGYSLLGVTTGTQSTNDFIYHFVPRISLSIFIELFSFFFLRIYKTNLDDIKHLTNERTNIDMKLLALRTALMQNDTDLLKIVIADLSKTERNFILKKGESTVDLEKGKLENRSSDKILENLTRLLSRK